jgi:putative flavoprotein involved in K+ transport
MTRAVVCGGGAAGLASAACLKRAGVEPVVLERGDGVGASWRGRYEGLRLNTLGWMSSLPGLRASRRRYGEYPSRDDWVRYLEDYTRHHELDVRFGVDVDRIDRAGGAWSVTTSQEELTAPIVVVATGQDREAYVPRWPGQDGFTGELLHAARFQSAEPFRDREVLVVGPGNTGSELAAFLVAGGARRVVASMRTPPSIFPRKWLGIPLNLSAVPMEMMPTRMADAVGRASQRVIYGDLSRYGLPMPEMGIKSTVEERLVAPAIDAGFVDAVKEGRIELKPTIERFDGPEVVLSDGERLRPDVVLCATGYRRGLEPLVGHLGVLDERGLPKQRPDVEVAGAPNLLFAGYTPRFAGSLRQIRFDARRIGRIVKKRFANA